VSAQNCAATSQSMNLEKIGPENTILILVRSRL
jgi:hypothetical protein